MNKHYRFLCSIILIGTTIINVHSQSPYRYRKINIDCNRRTNQRVFTSKEEFKRVCGGFTPSGVNFNTDVLVCLSYTLGGCSRPDVYIEVTKDVKTQTINCVLYAKNTGLCRKGYPSINWIVIKKPIGDYEIIARNVKY